MSLLIKITNHTDVSVATVHDAATLCESGSIWPIHWEPCGQPKIDSPEYITALNKAWIELEKSLSKIAELEKLQTVHTRNLIALEKAQSHIQNLEALVRRYEHKSEQPQEDYKAALELAQKRVIELENKLNTYEFNLSELYKGIFTIDQYNKQFKAPQVAEPSVQTNQGQWTGSDIFDLRTSQGGHGAGGGGFTYGMQQVTK